ncbi:MAG: hypothetical protein L3K26_11995 [Candidatus Hydrogenedentes bacterium]|nr:hypothetical protein [Candidatus Hydrogenedentota bacterium]
MNTRLEYMYRDGENYKQFGEVVLAGEVTIAQLKPHLYEGGFFMPSEVGLEDLQETPYLACDHVWHELEETVPIDNAPTVDISAKELLIRFKAAGRVKWDTKTVAARMMEVDGL